MMKSLFKEEIYYYSHFPVPESKEKLTHRYVWVCWWQGYEDMPSLCKSCYRQLTNSFDKSYTIILITKYNYSDYVSIPKLIIEKFDRGLIGVTQFSDVLRNELIKQKGGLWIDSTVFVSGFNVIDDIDNFSFWSVKHNTIDNKKSLGQLISKCNWTGFLMFGKPSNIVSSFVSDCFFKFFRNHDYVIDYFIQNFIIRLGLDNIPAFREAINNIPQSNIFLYELEKIMNDKYNKEKWHNISLCTHFFKLTWKHDYSLYCGNVTTFANELVFKCKDKV